MVTNDKRFAGKPFHNRSVKYLEKNKNPHKNCVDSVGFHVYLSSNSRDQVSQELKPSFFPKNPVNTGIFRIKDNKKCVSNAKERKLNFVVPYIDYLGRISLAPLGVWNTTPSSFLFSLTSTIYDRIRRRYLKKYLRHKNKDNFILKIACLYAVTNNSYLLMRLLNCLDRSIKQAQRLFYYFLKKHMCMQFRFCYDQMFLNVRWLKSQGPLRPMANLHIKRFQCKRFSSLITGESKRSDNKKVSNFEFVTKCFALDPKNDLELRDLTLSTGGFTPFRRNLCTLKK